MSFKYGSSSYAMRKALKVSLVTGSISLGVFLVTKDPVVSFLNFGVMTTVAGFLFGYDVKKDAFMVYEECKDKLSDSESALMVNLMRQKDYKKIVQIFKYKN